MFLRYIQKVKHINNKGDRLCVIKNGMVVFDGIYIVHGKEMCFYVIYVSKNIGITLRRFKPSFICSEQVSIYYNDRNDAMFRVAKPYRAVDCKLTGPDHDYLRTLKQIKIEF